MRARLLVLALLLGLLGPGSPQAAAAGAATTAGVNAADLHRIARAIERGDLDAARRQSQEATKRWPATLAPAALASALQELGSLLLDASLLPEAEAALQQALDLRATTALPAPLLATLHALLCQCVFERGDLDGARRHQEEAVALRRGLGIYGDPAATDAADDFYNLGYLCFELEDYTAALEAWQERLRLLRREAAANDQLIASCLSDIGEVSRRLGQYDRAESTMQEAIAVSEHVGRDRYHAVYLNNLGLLYWDQDRLDEAERLLKEALVISESDSNTAALRIVRAYENLGVLARDQNKMEIAAQRLQHALDLGRSTLGPRDVALVTVLDALGILDAALDRWEAAMLAWQEALDILEASPASHEMYRATILHNIAKGWLARDRPELAVQEFQRALDIRERVLDAQHPELGVTLAGMAEARARLQSAGAPQVRALLARAIPILSRSRAAPQVLAEAHALQATAMMAAGDRDSAIVEMQAAVSLVERLRPLRGGGDATRAQFLAKHTGDYHTLIGWLVEAGRLEEALGYAERARARVLQDQLGAAHVDLRHGIPPDRLRGLEARERDARAEINRLQREITALRESSGLDSTQAHRLADLEASLESALREFNEATEDMRLQSPAWRQLLSERAAVPSVREIQSRLLEKRSIFLLYDVGPQASYLFVLPPAPAALECHRLTSPAPGATAASLGEAELTHILMGDPSDHAQNLAGLVGQLRGIEVAPRPEGTTLAAQRLYALWQALLPEPVWAKVVAAKEAVVVPDAGLHLLPFEALVVAAPRPGKQPRFWLDAGPPIRYGHGITSLLDLAARSAMAKPGAASILTVSDPVFAADSNIGALAPLPGTRRESDAIRRSFAANDVLLLQGREADETIFKERAPAFRYIHLATHGIVDDSRDELLAALAFSPPPPDRTDARDDGFLHLFEIYELGLDSDLAVLSACGTHVGRRIAGEGVFALSRGFLVAGARRTVASLWPVSDESTALLMADFFRGISKQAAADRPVPYAALLRDAKRRLRQDPRWSSPLHWAPFVLIGAR